MSTEQEIPENSIACKVVALEGRNYIEIPLYNKNWLIGSPDKRVLDLYKKNNYAYNDVSADRTWQKFLNNIKRRKVYALIKQVNRTRAMADNKVQDVYTVYVGIHGENSKDMHETDSRMIGVWRQPKFTKERDPDTEELKTIGVDASTRLFDFTLDTNDEESVKAVSYLMEHCDPEVQFNVSPTPDSKSESIYDWEGFAKATLSELLEMGQRRMSLAELRQLRQGPGYYQSLQQPQQPQQNLPPKSNTKK